jgi:hypothetical protein
MLFRVPVGIIPIVTGSRRRPPKRRNRPVPAAGDKQADPPAQGLPRHARQVGIGMER